MVLEPRLRLYLRQDEQVSNDARPLTDLRGVFSLFRDDEGFFGDFAGGRLGWFNQAYSEAVFTSADRHNLIAAAYDRAGLQWQSAEGQHRLRLFLETYGAVDRNKWFYNNRWEVRPTAAWILQASASFSVWAMAGPVFVEYLGPTKDDAPQRRERWGTRALLILNSFVGD